MGVVSQVIRVSCCYVPIQTEQSCQMSPQTDLKWQSLWLFRRGCSTKMNNIINHSWPFDLDSVPQKCLQVTGKTSLMWHTWWNFGMGWILSFMSLSVCYTEWCSVILAYSNIWCTPRHNHSWQLDLFTTLHKRFCPLTPCLARWVDDFGNQSVFTCKTMLSNFIPIWIEMKFLTLGSCNESFLSLTFLTSVVEKWHSWDILMSRHKINMEYT